MSCSNNATIEQVVDHIVHARNVASIDNVGLGADFDGIDYTTTGLEVRLRDFRTSCLRIR